MTESGYVQLSWTWDGDLNSNYSFELQQATSQSFENPELIYEGPDFATFLSGLDNGHYYFRIRAVNGNQSKSSWSSPAVVEVEHHSLSLALSLFGLGALVFAITVGIVIQGNKNSSQNI